MKRLNFETTFYLLGSIVLALVFSAGLSGWFLDYPMWLFTSLLVVFLIPPVLMLLDLPVANRANIAMMWAGSLLLALRIISGVMMGDVPIEGREALILITFLTVPVVWAVVWTRRLRASASFRSS